MARPVRQACRPALERKTQRYREDLKSRRETSRLVLPTWGADLAVLWPRGKRKQWVRNLSMTYHGNRQN